MKQLLLLSTYFFCLNTTLYSQLPNGSPAPSFTVTDINGNSHSLNQYLSEGKIVILDFFTSWCWPCWYYKETGELENLYKTYGPDGSNEIVVLQIESDQTTGLEHLNGEVVNNFDWISTSELPIIDDANIGVDYGITNYPTYIIVCPNGLGEGVIYKQEIPLENAFLSALDLNCGNQLIGVKNYLAITADEIELCSISDNFDVTIENRGVNPILSTKVELVGLNFETVLNFSDTLYPNEQRIVSITNPLTNGDSNIVLRILEVNGFLAHQSSFTEKEIELKYSRYLSSREITVNFFTDNWPKHSSWKIVDENQIIVASGGPYVGFLASPGGADAFKKKASEHTLPIGEHCYSVQIHDLTGDGMQEGIGLNNGGFGIQILCEGEEIINCDPKSYWKDVELKNNFRTDNFSTVNHNSTDVFTVYPNPASNLLYISFQDSSLIDEIEQFQLTDFSGKIITQLNSFETKSNLIELDFQNIQKGVYLLSFVTSNEVFSQYLVIE